ncbi:MAG: pyruvate kinase [Oscillospiraceae bacterium]|nr:pyruvate kinase [Oscillospiraceae bacterium]
MKMKNPRKTKIVCTLGPAVSDRETLKELMKRGMNCARLNFSHGSHPEHLERADMVKELREELGLHVALMLDTKGPEIRTKTLPDGKIELEKGKNFTLYCDEREGSETGVSVTYANLCREISPGTRILIDDGLIELSVLDISGEEIHCVILNGGSLGNNKSINLPEVAINLPAITERDEADIAFACQHDFDFVAASFVRKASDVETIRRVLEKHGGTDIRIISKIENQEGVNNATEIIELSDGIMVARGDLGVEIPAEEVPMVQKMLISECVRRGKPVITATQMLDSMIRNPRPTRAEVSDVANAVFDGTSCVMLSGETASGKYPLEALSTMVRIVERANSDPASSPFEMIEDSELTISDAMTYAACTTAKSLDANAIVSVTASGHTPRMISRFRPSCPIIAVTPFAKVQRQLALAWGVVPCNGKDADSTDELFTIGTEKAKEVGLVEDGDLVVIVAGVPVGKTGNTNLIKAQRV